MPMSCLLCSLGPGPVSVTFIKHIRFYTKAQGSTPSDWSKEMHGESCWGSWQGWHTVNLMVGDFWSEFLKCQPRVRSGRAEGSPEVRNCQVQAGEGGGICLHLSCSSCNPERDSNALNTRSQETKTKMFTVSDSWRYLCVYFLWDGVLFDPWMDFSQLLSLLLAEPRLEGLKHSKLLPVLCQNLVLVPAGRENMRWWRMMKKR